MYLETTQINNQNNMARMPIMIRTEARNITRSDTEPIEGLHRSINNLVYKSLISGHICMKIKECLKFIEAIQHSC
jgi:hypothetical protein